MSQNNYHGSLHQDGEWKKKVVRSARRKNKKMGIGRRDGKNKKKGESEKEDITVIEQMTFDNMDETKL